MIPLAEAFEIIRREAGAPEPLSVDLREAHGYVLAQSVFADRDFPPFDRSLVDGYAVKAADVGNAPAELEIIEYVPAGRVPQKTLSDGKAARIMTGAPLPKGTECVVMVEHTEAVGAHVDEFNGSARVKILKPLKTGMNLARQGTDSLAGSVVIPGRTLLGPAEIAVLAAVGKTEVPVFRKPRLAILGTGDEVIEPSATPKPSQIRNSNSYQLLAQAAQFGLDATYLGIAPDEMNATKAMIAKGLEADILVSTGGVSAGDKDFAGEAFKSLGVQICFNRVAVKPGKPTTFGLKDRKLVFGLPGNPVASLVTFHLFVMTAVRHRMGFEFPLPRHLRLPLKTSAGKPDARPTFRPARLVLENGVTLVDAQRWHGSGDLTACVNADGFLFQDSNETLEAGKHVNFFPLKF
jgi:molybdopterin molybdotransferase